MTDHDVSKVAKEKLCEYLKAALADKENGSFKDAKEILGYLSSENILEYLSDEVLSDAILWLDSLYNTEDALISSNDHQSSFLLKGVAFDNDVIRGMYIVKKLSELVSLRQKLVKKQSKLKEAALDQREAKLNAKLLPDYKGSKQIFTRISDYKRIGDELRKENKLQVVDDMNSLAGEIYKKENNNYRMAPSFVVCCSSGTGKTQLPFCFDNEILYFVLESSQVIYDEYRRISNHLNDLIDIDFENFCEGITFNDKEKKPENDSGYELIGFSRTAMDKRGKRFSSYSLDFIFNLIKSVADLKSNPANQTKSWIELELDENIFIPFSSMTIFEAAEALKELVKSGTVARLPLIFLDEFNVGSKSSEKAKAHYSFYRNIFRAAGLIPVVMGTDSHIANLVPTNNNASGNETFTWGFVFYKLPSYPNELLKSKLREMNIKDQKFLKLMEDVLVKERPLFVEAVLNHLNRLKIKSENELNSMIADNFTLLFSNILYEIQQSFLTRKSKQLEKFIFGQFSLFENASAIRSEEKSGFSPLIIHQHLGYLNCPSNIHPDYADKSYFELFSEGGTLKYETYKVTGEPTFTNYFASCSLPLTDQEPLTCLALSINFDTENCAMRNQNKNFTSFQSFIQLKTVSIEIMLNTSNIFFGKYLENIVTIAYMISTHINGIDGLSFSEWFPYFIQQLGCYVNNDVGSNPNSNESNRECSLSAGNLNGSASAIFCGSVERISKKFRLERPEKIDMSICDKTLLNSHIAFAGFNGAMWDKNLKNYLLDRGYKLGSFIGSSNESRDLNSMTLKKLNSDLNRNDVNCASVNNDDFELTKELTEELSFENRSKDKHHNILVCECKLHSKKISNSIIREIVDKMIDSHVYAPIVIIVARQFVKNIKNPYENFDDADYKNINFYHLKRESTMPIESEKCHIHQEGSSLKLELLSKKRTPTGEECNAAKNLNCSNSEPKRLRTNVAKSKNQSNNSDQLELSSIEPFSVILVELTEIHGNNNHMKKLLSALIAK